MSLPGQEESLLRKDRLFWALSDGTEGTDTSPEDYTPGQVLALPTCVPPQSLHATGPAKHQLY